MSGREGGGAPAEVSGAGAMYYSIDRLIGGHS